MQEEIPWMLDQFMSTGAATMPEIVEHVVQMTWMQLDTMGTEANAKERAKEKEPCATSVVAMATSRERECP